MDEIDGISPDIEAGTVEYWKARARQWQKRCQQAEREKTELIEEIERLKLAATGPRSARQDRRRAILADGALGGTTGAPGARGWH